MNFLKPSDATYEDNLQGIYGLRKSSISAWPTAVFVCGLHGSGKTYFSVQFACMIDAAYLCIDKLRLKLFEEYQHSADKEPAVYGKMLQKAKHLLSEKKTVVLDASFFSAAIRNDFQKELHGQARQIFIEVCADKATRDARLSRKGQRTNQIVTPPYRRVKEKWEPILEKHLVLQSTERNILHMLELALTHYKTCAFIYE